MLFDTPIFFVFLIAVVAAYWRLPRRPQSVFLLLASYLFYGWWDFRFLALMIFSTGVDFLIAGQVAPGEEKRHRRGWLAFSLLLNFSILGFFKYFDFFIGSFASATAALGVHHLPLPLLRIILPPGISFYTFQEVAYIVDVYKGKIPPAESFVDYSLFISLFPHLIAGPIQRPDHLLPQVQRARAFDADQFLDGMQLILFGLIRKCVVADNCAILADAAFSGRLGHPNIPVTLIGTWAFAWQIYGDFSGYSDIARGCAQLLGFHFMVNFRQPYLADSLQDFWRRWHISLSTWLRDYLYIPLGGNREGKLMTYRNLMITMLLGGLWHGASWTFVVWGGIHGIGLALERLFSSVKRTVAATADEARHSWWWLGARRILIFNLVCVAWIFFRAQTFGTALGMLEGVRHWAWQREYLGALVMLGMFTLPLLLMDCVLEHKGDEYLFAHSAYGLRVATAMIGLAALAIFSANNLDAFIYFQF